MKLTLNDLITVLSGLPEEAKGRQIKSIVSGVDGAGRDIPVYQLELENKNGHRSYILVPKNRGDVAYDSYGKRQLPEEKKGE